MQLHPQLKKILEDIKFLSRYKALREKYPFIEESFEDYSNNEVLRVLESLGYKAKYNKRENFFGIKESVRDFKFTFNICLKYGFVELIWAVTKDMEMLTLGGPWGFIGDLLLGRRCNIKKPTFRNYEDLEDILKEAFIIYEDFKEEIVKKMA